MGLIVSFGDYGVGDIVQNAQDLYDLLLDLCQDQLDWANILNKPELYVKSELYNKEEIDEMLEDIAPGAHTHTIADVEGLQEALDDRYTKEESDALLIDKSDVGHTHPVTDIEGLDEAIAALGVQIVDELPMPVTNGKVYMLHSEGDARFLTFISAGDAYVPLDAVTYSALSTALASKQNKLTGLATQYVKGDGTYGTFDKAAIGLGNVDNTSDLNKPLSTAVISALGLKANDSDVLKKTGNQTKTSGILTFALSPVVPVPTNSEDAANKGYVDSKIDDATRRYSVVIGDGVNKDFTVTHDLDSTAVNIVITRNSDGKLVNVAKQLNPGDPANSVLIGFAQIPGLDSYTVSITP